MADLDYLPEHLTALLAHISEQERNNLALKIARKIRSNQRSRISRQQNPDGSSYIPRKNLRGRKGKIRQKMFNKIKNAQFLRIEKIPQGVAIGFSERISRIANVHQFGLMDQVKHNSQSPRVKYAKRELLGFSEHEIDLIEYNLLEHFGST